MGENPALEKKRLAMQRSVRDTVEALIVRHFPSATPNRFDDNIEGIFGIDQHPRDDTHSARVFSSEINNPQFLHFCKNLTPDAVTQDHAISSCEDARQALLIDLNRLFTGSDEGQMVEDRPRVIVGTSTQTPVGGLNIILRGTAEELHGLMQQNITKHPELKDFIPKGGAVLS